MQPDAVHETQKLAAQYLGKRWAMYSLEGFLIGSGVAVNLIGQWEKGPYLGELFSVPSRILLLRDDGWLFDVPIECLLPAEVPDAAA